jgi:hypothetical protein
LIVISSTPSVPWKNGENMPVERRDEELPGNYQSMLLLKTVNECDLSACIREAVKLLLEAG